MAKISKFDILAALVLSGEATEEQKIEFDEILESSKEKQIAFEKLKAVWQVPLRGAAKISQKQIDYLWLKYQSEQYNLRRRRWNRYKIAASIALAIGASIFLYTRQIDAHEAPVIAVKEMVKETNPGEKLKTQLPDGTVVHLNAGSRITFPDPFADSIRLVHLIGEGYFDVAQDKSRPFTVKTSSMEITALGTAFGVNAYAKNDNDQVSLVSGKLFIRNARSQEINVEPGETVTLSKSDFSFVKSEMDYLSEIAWKDGILHFKNNSFDEIIQVLELSYGVTFEFDDRFGAIPDVYTGAFKNESLDNILRILSFSMDFKYEINGKRIMIKKK